MNIFKNMENNINMNYENLIMYIGVLLLAIIIVFVIGYILLKLGFNVILSCEIHNKKIEVKLSFIFLFNLINITKVVYPISKTDEAKDVRNKNKWNNKEDMKKSLHLNMIDFEQLVILFRLIKKVNVVEIYSNLEYGSDIIEITSFIYFLVNVIYGNIFSYFNSDNIYLNIKPCYTREYIDYTGKLHIKPTVKDIVCILIAIIAIYIRIRKYTKIKKDKENDIDEISKFNKESDGYNA